MDLYQYYVLRLNMDTANPYQHNIEVHRLCIEKTRGWVFWGGHRRQRSQSFTEFPSLGRDMEHNRTFFHIDISLKILT